MGRKSPDIVVTEIFPKPKEAKYPSLDAARDAAKPYLADSLVFIIKDMIANGHLVNKNGKLVPDIQKIETDKAAEKYRKEHEEENKTVFIYVLIDPRNEEVRYVGQTRNLEARFIQHVIAGAPRVKRWIEELKKYGKKPNIKVIDETIVKNANLLEKKLIKKYAKKFNLLNTIHNNGRRRTNASSGRLQGSGSQ